MRVGTASDAAALLRVSRDRVYELAQLGPHRGGIPSLRRVGSRLRFDLDELERWLPTPCHLTRDGHPRRVRLSKGVNWDLADEKIAALPSDGWVYLAQSTRGGPIKIGFTDDVDRRLRVLQAACPFPLVVLAKLPGGRRLEYQLHRRFAAYRQHGEWFSEHAPGLAGLIREAVA